MNVMQNGTSKASIAVFLDRDGTLNQEKGYIRNLDDLALIAGAARAVKALNDYQVLAILTTNQTGAARGFYSEDHINALNARVSALLLRETGARLDAVYYCPHWAKSTMAHYAIACRCRKPEPGMIESACQAFPAIDCSRSYVIGDKASDVMFAKNTGCKSILVKTGYGQRVLDGKYQVLEQQPDYICENTEEAVFQVILPAVIGYSPDECQ
ncbi:MAG: HAD family hydrolase [Cyanobacteria bacterium P01_H01_bin.74]